MALWPQHNHEGYFIGSAEDFGSGLAPHNCAEQDDWPEVIAGFIPRRNRMGDSPPYQWLRGWEQVEDHRGEEGFLNGQNHTISQPGPYPSGWSFEPPAQEQPEEKRRNAIMARLRELDFATIRPLRVQKLGEAGPEDEKKLAEIEAEVVQLRSELAEL